MGKIGYRLAQKAHFGFGMNIHYCDPVRLTESREKELQATYHENLNDVLAIADCVAIAIPLTPENTRLINAEALSVMKPGSRIVNVSRGRVVDEKALVEALKSGHLFSAGLDVHYNEPEVYIVQLLPTDILGQSRTAKDGQRNIAATYGRGYDQYQGRV